MKLLSDGRDKRRSYISVVVALVFAALLVWTLDIIRCRLEDITASINRQDVVIEAQSKQIPTITKYIQIVRTLHEVAQGKMNAYQISEVSRIVMVYCEMNSGIGLVPGLVLALMERESGFNPAAISEAHAYGLMQCLQVTFDIHLPAMGYNTFSRDLALNPVVNIEVGLRELVRLRKYWMSEGVDSWMITLTSYYWGTRVTWGLFLNKSKAVMPSLEYGKGVIDMQHKWEKRGL